MQYYKLDITNCDLKSKYKPSSLADVNWVREERISSSGRDVAACFYSRCLSTLCTIGIR